MTLSCSHQFEFIHASGSVLFKMQLVLLYLDRLLKPPSTPNCTGRGIADKMLIAEVGKREKTADYMRREHFFCFFSRSMLVLEVYNL